MSKCSKRMFDVHERFPELKSQHITTLKTISVPPTASLILMGTYFHPYFFTKCQIVMWNGHGLPRLLPLEGSQPGTKTVPLERASHFHMDSFLHGISTHHLQQLHINRIRCRIIIASIPALRISKNKTKEVSQSFKERKEKKKKTCCWREVHGAICTINSDGVSQWTAQSFHEVC